MAWEDIYKARGMVQKAPMRVVQLMAAEIGQSHEPLRFLDAGSGTGRHTFYLAEEFPNATIDCFDNSPTSVELLGELTAAANLADRIWTDVLDFDGNLKSLEDRAPYDAYLSTLVIHHGYWKQILARHYKLFDLTKVDGLIAFAAISESDARAATGFEAEPRTRLATAQDDGDVPHHFFNRADIDELFKECDIIFADETIKPAVTAVGDAVHWEVLARKRNERQIP